MDKHELLTMRQVEAELSVSRTTLWRWRDSGKLRTSRLGSIIRISRRDLTRFIESEFLAGRIR